MSKKRILLVDYQSTKHYLLSEEEKKVQRLKKSIIFLQNRQDGLDTSRKTKKNYTHLLLSLGKYLKDNKHYVFYVSLPDDMQLYKKMLSETDFVLFWATTPIFETVKNYLIAAKKEYPNIITIMAGYHVSGLPKYTLENIKEIDYISIGESEYAVNLLLNGEKKERIPGIAYRKGSKVAINSKTRLLTGDEIPAPDYSLLNGDKRKYRYYLQISRSCTYRCKYCVYGYFGKEVRSRSSASVRQELIVLREILGNSFEMHILDNVISYDLKIIQELRKIINELDLKLSFSADIRPELITVEVLEELVKLNVRQLFIGFEDANNNCRKNAGRFMTNETLIKALLLMKKYPSIKPNCYWMLGLPGTTCETIRQNIYFVKDLLERKLIVNICPDTIFVPLPGTPFFNESEKYGISNLDKKWENYRRSNYWPVFDLETISREELHYGLLDFDKAIIATQLKCLGLSETEALDEYFSYNNGACVEDFLK